MAVDGVEGPPYRVVGDPVFSPDSSSVAYRAWSLGRAHLVRDGSKVGSHDYIPSRGLVFSKQGGRLAYVARDDGQERVILDGVPGAAFDGVDWGSVAFSDDGTELLYIAARNGMRLVVRNGEEGPLHEEAGSLAIAPITNRVTYLAQDGNERFVVVDGEPHGPYTGIGPAGVVFSSDGERVAYGVTDDEGKAFVVIDEEEQPLRHTGVSSIQFSRDGSHVMYYAWDGSWYGRNHLVVVDGKKGASYDYIENAQLSSTGAPVLYVAWANGKEAVVVDEVPGRWYDEVLGDGPHWHEDGTIEYLALEGMTLYRVKNVLR